LHWNVSHLCLNLVTLVIFTGGLEYLAGSAIAAACYVIPMCLANPLTASLMTVAQHGLPSIDLSEIDVGASLGIFGTAGALSLFVRWGGWLLGCLSAAGILAAAAGHSVLPLNHLIALAVGLTVGRAILRK
jgi:membrane associated rhomboid family serine protease